MGPDRARDVACHLLSRELPRRWQHVQGVAGRAAEFGDVHDHRTTRLLIAAGYVHDIGYAPSLHDTGFHPIDGARHLRRLGFHEHLVSLVAHHTCAALEAELWDLRHQLEREFPWQPQLPHDELLYCDLTTDPTGRQISVPDRLADIRHRYGPDTTVRRFVDRAEPDLEAAALRAAAKLAGTGRRPRAWPAVSELV